MNTDRSPGDTDPSLIEDPRVRAHAAAYLFGAGGLLVLVSLLTPHSGDDVGLAGVAVLGLMASLFLLAVGRRATPTLLHTMLVVGTVLITGLVHFAQASGAYPALYVWVILYAAYFFTRLAVTLHLVLIAALYAAVLLTTPAPDPFARWVVGVGTNLVAGLLVSALVTQVRASAFEARQRAERVRAERRRMRAILDATSEAFMAIDDSGTVVDVNPAAERLSGWSREQLLGRSFTELIPPNHRDDLAQQVARLASGEDRELLTEPREFVVQHRDGNTFPAEATVSSLEDAPGRWTLSAFVRDIRERKRTEQTMREQIEDLEVIAAVARDLAGVTHAEAARPAICKAGARLTDASLVVLYEPDAKGLELVPTAVFGARERLAHLPFAGQTSGAGSAFSTARPLFVPDCSTYPELGQRMVDGVDLRSAMWQPIISNGVPIGVLAAAWTERVDSVSVRMTTVLDLLAAEASVAIERAELLGRLESVARTDELTGLSNRRAWEEQLPREMAGAARQQRSLCVAMLDLDRFKAFNDRLGHPAGDRLLKELAAQWRSTLRPTDMIARYGGEEFAVLLAGCEMELAMEIVERLRSISVEGQTCSAGVAQWDGEESASTLLERADRALYEAKATGRDRAVAL
jgi:diguanylate cyclase (GGDEF)-like protein/PAS domain S-box-containing protein